MDEKLFNRVFDILNSMAEARVILWKVDFDTCIGKDGCYILRLNCNALAEKLLKSFYDNYIRSSENSIREVSSEEEAFKTSMIGIGINPDGLRGELAQKSYCIQSSYSVNFYPHEGDVRKRSYRAVLIDIYKLQAAGADIDHLLSDNRKER